MSRSSQGAAHATCSAIPTTARDQEVNGLKNLMTISKCWCSQFEPRNSSCDKGATSRFHRFHSILPIDRRRISRLFETRKPLGLIFTSQMAKKKRYQAMKSFA